MELFLRKLKECYNSLVYFVLGDYCYIFYLINIFYVKEAIIYIISHLNTIYNRLSLRVICDFMT